MKTWNDVNVGDYIYYYDHCKMHKQYVHYAAIELKHKEYSDWRNPNRKIIEEYKILVLEVGPTHKRIEFNEYYFDKTDWLHWGIHRFSCKESAEKWFKTMVDWRLKRAEKFRIKYEKEISILEKYAEFNKDF